MEQERDEFQAGPIAKVLVGAIVVGIGAVAVAALLLGHAPPSARPHVAPRTIGSIEQTQITRTAAGLDLRERQRAELDGYRWVDRDAGVAAIPIERAMEIIAGGKP